MTKANAPVEEVYAKIVRAFSANAGVTMGTKGKKGFGSSALRTKNKIFAMVSSKGAFVVKLPKERVDELVASGAGKRFDPGHGRIMKEWIELDSTVQKSWLKLAREAESFVSKGA
ncbi:MAG: TfoX/Sxy family protein [Pedosphaera sp.]|nr:TfoX/Sxy family protein [Pedosphaera sp.]